MITLDSCEAFDAVVFIVSFPLSFSLFIAHVQESVPKIALQGETNLGVIDSTLLLLRRLDPPSWPIL
jgi:hypothetical protein